MVPNGWMKHTGSEITTKITKGSSPKWQGFDYQDSGTLFVTSENVRDGYLDISKPKYLPPEFNQKLKNSQLRNGDILINIVGASIGRSCQYHLSGQQANINQAVCLFRPNKLAESDYIQQYLQLPSTVNRLLGTQTESARPNLSLSDMRDFIFAIPPLPEQRKIAKILSTWDQAIATTERLIAASQQQKKALMQQLLTGKKRLVNPETGEVFEGDWVCQPLVKVAKMQAGKFVKAEDIFNERNVDMFPCYGGNGLRGFTTSFTHEGTFSLIGRQGALCGNITLAEGKFHATEHAVVVTPYKKITTKWLYYKLIELDLNKYATGQAQPGLSVKNLEPIELLTPSVEEQQKIASVLTAADQEIELLEAKLAHLKDEKKALMQQLLTGKRRVKVDATEVA